MKRPDGSCRFAFRGAVLPADKKPRGRNAERPLKVLGGDLQPPLVSVLTPATMPDCPHFIASEAAVNTRLILPPVVRQRFGPL